MDWRGFELHPETPAGGVALTDYFGAGRVEPMRRYLDQFAARFGITDMRHPDRLPNTRRALAAAELARDRGRLEPFRHGAMDAYWREGRDLEDEAVIREVAVAAGLAGDDAVAAMTDDRYLARIAATRTESIDAGVTGIPTFFIGDRVVVGCQPYEVLADAVRGSGAAGTEDP